MTPSSLAAGCDLMSLCDLANGRLAEFEAFEVRDHLRLCRTCAVAHEGFALDRRMRRPFGEPRRSSL